MKKLTFITIIVILFFCSCKNEKENDWHKEKLKGDVKSLVENSYKAEKKFGEIVKGEKYWENAYHMDKQTQSYMHNKQK